MSKSIGLMVLVGALFAVGCGDKGGGGDASAKPAASGEAKSGGGDSIGVAECDDYFKKMEACLGKMPAEGKPAMETAMKTSRDAWKQAADQGGAAKDALKTTCKAAVDALAQNPACK